jgi:hypothetical protein
MVLDATIAGASANAYLTVAEADVFAASDIGKFATDWLSATVDTKEAALVRATDEIDGEVGRVVYRATAEQALLFPRAEDRTTLGAWLLPVRLRRAVYLQAAFLVANANVLDQAASFRARGLSNFSNPDGTGGQVADDPGFGALHPRVRTLLVEYAEGATIGIIIPT